MEENILSREVNILQDSKGTNAGVTAADFFDLQGSIHCFMCSLLARDHSLSALAQVPWHGCGCSRAASEAALKPVTARFRFKILGRSARFDHNHSSDGPAAAAVKPSRHRFRLIYCAGYVPGISCHVLARNTRRVPRPNGPTRPDRSLGRARVGYFIQPEPHQAGPSRLGPQI